MTKGCLWTLHQRLRIPIVNPFQERDIDLEEPLLHIDEIQQLDVLCRCIVKDYAVLAGQIRNFVKRVREEDTAADLPIRTVMARNVIRPIQTGKDIAIGSLTGSEGEWGIFVAESTSSHCFTAWKPREWTPSLNASRYLEKVIALEVEVAWIPESVPCLTIHRWVAGLYSLEHAVQQEVLLPWPASTSWHGI